jgi:hypothetical protein
MNTELINQLKSQCIVREQRGTTAFNSYMVDRFDTEKFADSIVWECMKICEDVMKKDNSALACWSAIKGTFRS